MAARYRLCILSFALLILANPAAGQTLKGQARASSSALISDGKTNSHHSAKAERLHAITERSGTSLNKSASALESVWRVKDHLFQVWDAEANDGMGDWLNDYQIRYTYTEGGLQAERVFDGWDEEIGDWIFDFLTTWTYNEQGLPGEVTDSSWDPLADGGSGAWVIERRVTTTYNDRRKVLVSTTEFADDGDFFIWSRDTYTYDESGEVVLQRVTESGLFGPLAPSRRETYTYDSGQLTEIFVEAYQSDEWMPLRRDSRVYDDEGRITERTMSSWDIINNDWLNITRTLTSYSENQTETISQTWSGGAWLNVGRDIETLDFNAGTATTVEQYWDASANGGAGDWVNEDYEELQFTEEFQLIGFIERVWSSDAWVDSRRGSAELDENGNTSVQLSQFWNGTEWVNEERFLFTYIEFDATASEREIPGGRFQLEDNYPNPFSATTTISFTLETPDHVTLDVFDVLGRRVATLVDAVKGRGVHEVTLDARELSGGLYVYRLSASGHQAVRTMLILK